ncbi:hypothetical protein [Trichocoleus desertorum]
MTGCAIAFLKTALRKVRDVHITHRQYELCRETEQWRVTLR